MKFGKGIFFLLGTLCFFGIFFAIRQTTYYPTLKIGVNAYSGAEYFSLARKMNLFNKVGVHVKIVELGSFQDVQQAFEWQQIDGMVCPLVDAMVEIQKLNYNHPKIILIASYPKSNIACHLLVNSNVKNLQDLKGKRIGVETASFGIYVLSKALRKIGLTLNDVEIIPMDPTAASTFFAHERIDGVVIYPPFLKTVENNLKSIYSTQHWPKEMQLNVLLMSEKALKTYKRQLRDFIKNWDKLINFYQENPDFCNDVLAHHYSISPELANTLLTSSNPLRLSEQIPLLHSNRYILDIMADIQNEILESNHLPLTTKDALKNIFDAAPLQQAIKE